MELLGVSAVKGLAIFVDLKGEKKIPAIIFGNSVCER